MFLFFVIKEVLRKSGNLNIRISLMEKLTFNILNQKCIYCN